MVLVIDEFFSQNVWDNIFPNYYNFTNGQFNSEPTSSDYVWSSVKQISRSNHEYAQSGV